MKHEQHRIHRRLIPAIMSIALVAGCSTPSGDSNGADAGSNPDAGPNLDGQPIPLEAYATQSARLLCETAERCGTMYFVAFLAQEQIADCTAQMAQFVENNLVAQLKTSIAAGRIVYDSERARGCIDGSAEFACGVDVETEDCRNAFQGQVPDGGACAISEECGPTSECDGADGCATPGTCVHIPQRGETCTSNCAGDSYCDDSGMCIARLANGASCRSDPECEPELKCVADVCSPRTRPGEGEACEGSCDTNLVCATNTEGMRVCRAPRTDGTCTSPLDCPVDQLCDDGMCAPYPTTGQPCTYACASGSRCLEGMCYAIIPTGSACEHHGECATTHCNAGTCASPYVCE